MSRIDRLVGQLIASGALSKAEKAKRRKDAAEGQKRLKHAERDRLRLGDGDGRRAEREAALKRLERRRLARAVERERVVKLARVRAKRARRVGRQRDGKAPQVQTEGKRRL